jgi:hypothetical protein
MMDTIFILYADHEYNASTFAARVTASTLADMYAAVTSACGTLKGPLHGGANEESIYMLNEIATPDKAEACKVPASPKEPARGASVDLVNSNTRVMARLLAMGLACNQTRVFNFVHTASSSETYIAGQSKIYHQITHDEPTDAQLGFQPETSKLASLVMQGFGEFLTEMNAIKEGDGTLLDNMLVLGLSDTGYAKIHAIENIPMFLAGGAGGKHKAGQHVHSSGEPVTRVSLTAMQLAGAPVGEFGVGTMKTARPISEVMA